jgi:hypothetical protein
VLWVGETIFPTLGILTGRMAGFLLFLDSSTCVLSSLDTVDVLPIKMSNEVGLAIPCRTFTPQTGYELRGACWQTYQEKCQFPIVVRCRSIIRDGLFETSLPHDDDAVLSLYAPTINQPPHQWHITSTTGRHSKKISRSTTHFPPGADLLSNHAPLPVRLVTPLRDVGPVRYLIPWRPAIVVSSSSLFMLLQGVLAQSSGELSRVLPRWLLHLRLLE